jgi:hypothetical protein
MAETPEDPATPRIQVMHDMMPADWDRKPLALAHEIRNFLSSVKDQGTEIDSGTDGMSGDLWVKIGGVEWYINIRKSNGQLLKEGHSRESLGLPPLSPPSDDPSGQPPPRS